MSFWFFGRKEKGRRNYYSVTILIPAILFFVALFIMFVARILRGLIP